MQKRGVFHQISFPFLPLPLAFESLLSLRRWFENVRPELSKNLLTFCLKFSKNCLWFEKFHPISKHLEVS